MAGVPVATVVVGTNPADPTGATVRLTVTGAVSAIMWRFGDCTDHPDPTPGVMDHTFTAGGDYQVIGHVGATGQRLVETVTVPDLPPPAGTTFTPTTVTAAAVAVGDVGFDIIGPTWPTDPWVTLRLAADPPLTYGFGASNPVLVDATHLTGQLPWQCDAAGSPYTAVVWESPAADTEFLAIPGALTVT